MTSNYNKISKENQKCYGTDIARIGELLLAGLYSHKTHFIFELLQNAEDAISRRNDGNHGRQVTFNLTSKELIMSHFGIPFNEDDVKSVCSIAESTKDSTSIGRFGIGFKSVYAFTDSPEIHSGDEDFIIKDYVHPKFAEPLRRAPGQTLIILPLKPKDKDASGEITKGFQMLGPSTLLFLRHIEKISWSAKGGASGFYYRSESVKHATNNVRQVELIGQESGKPEVNQHWLIFGRNVSSPSGEKVGAVEIAFFLHPPTDDSSHWLVKPVTASPLVVFFPTVVETRLGFLVQGPYCTTPSRDSIRFDDEWNQHLVKEIAKLLVQAMRWLRDKAMLDISALSCLPINRDEFSEESGFFPLFEAVKAAFIHHDLLPAFGGSYISAPRAKLARTKEVRELFTPKQVSELYGEKMDAWLSGDITQDRAPDIKKYLMDELGIVEETPETLIRQLSKEFLEAQSNKWILRLYEFLSRQEVAVRRSLNTDTTPLIRLTDGSHIPLKKNGKVYPYLPGTSETGLPTVDPAVCASDDARSFLESLGITEPNLVDDVICNVLPKYKEDVTDVSKSLYATDISRILRAFKTDSAAQKARLTSALQESKFVAAINTGNNEVCYMSPSNVYIATDKLKRLFCWGSGCFYG